MPVTPDRLEYEVGKTKLNQRLWLIGEREGGQLTWTLRKDAFNQRDETDSIHGLSRETLVKIGEIASGHR